jgi:hypothetical protein
MIPERLEDPFTIIYKSGRKHNLYTHLGCILLRILLGLLIYFRIRFFKNIFVLIPLFLSIIIFFSYKLIKTNNKTWKVYIRTILIYIISLLITSIEHLNTVNVVNAINTSGILIILDALMGLQSRHIQNNFKE